MNERSKDRLVTVIFVAGTLYLLLFYVQLIADWWHRTHMGQP
jgi:hypothetical protein